MLIFAAIPVLLMQQAPAENVDWDKEFGVGEVERDSRTGELPVSPYEQSNANAGAKPFDGKRMSAHFDGKAGIRRIANRFVDLNYADPRVASIFAGHDEVRLRRTLFEQFCFILNAGCNYTGRDMKSSHEALGTRKSDLNAIVENLQKAMSEEGVPFSAQNRFLAKLAPMSGDVITR